MRNLFALTLLLMLVSCDKSTEAIDAALDIDAGAFMPADPYQEPCACGDIVPCDCLADALIDYALLGANDGGEV